MFLARKTPPGGWPGGVFASVADRRTLDRQTIAAARDVKLQRHEFGTAGRERLGAGVTHAALEPRMHRVQLGVLQTVDRKPVDMTLAEMIGADTC